MTTAPLEESASALVNAAGTATILMKPVPNWCTWTLNRFSVACGGTLRPSCKVYRNSVSDSNLIDATNNGTANTSDSVVRLEASSQLLVVWSAGTPGARATVTISGTQDGP